jgi:hypothetical protein
MCFSKEEVPLRARLDLNVIVNSLRGYLTSFADM